MNLHERIIVQTVLYEAQTLACDFYWKRKNEYAGYSDEPHYSWSDKYRQFEMKDN